MRKESSINSIAFDTTWWWTFNSRQELVTSTIRLDHGHRNNSNSSCLWWSCSFITILLQSYSILLVVLSKNAKSCVSSYCCRFYCDIPALSPVISVCVLFTIVPCYMVLYIWSHDDNNLHENGFPSSRQTQRLLIDIQPQLLNPTLNFLLEKL